MFRLKCLLFINQTQFGYHTVSYYYCKYLRNNYRIVYLCFDENKERVNLDNVDVVYLHIGKNKIIKYFRFLRAIRRHYKKNYIIMVKYFRGAFIIPIITNFANAILDIRSGSVNRNEKISILLNYLLRLETKFYRRVTIISSSLAKELYLQKYHVLPLGADIVRTNPKVFDKLKLLYVGSLVNRNLEVTIRGIDEFIRNGHSRREIEFVLIGQDKNNAKLKLERLISDLKLDKLIDVYDEVPFYKLYDFFQECNVGISFVPMIHVYQSQPPIKTFEYIAAGMIVLATKTIENQKIINPINGILIEDNYRDFARGLNEIYLRRSEFDSSKIKETISDYYYGKIVNNQLFPFLQMVESNMGMNPKS